MVSDAGTGKVCQLSCARLKAVAPSNVAGLLDQGANDHPALVIPDRVSLTYARLRELTEEAAHALASHGVGMGDRVPERTRGDRALSRRFQGRDRVPAQPGI